MPIKRRPGKVHVSSELTSAEHAFLHDQPLPPDAGFDEESAWWSMARWGDEDTFREGRPSVRAMWEAMGESIVEQWARERPGRRPACWWRYSSPVPRARLSGTGEASWPDRLHRGLPQGWVWPRRLPPGATIEGGPPPCDPSDPPTFESQASYLRRLSLLRPGEEARLTDADFEPERLRPRDD